MRQPRIKVNAESGEGVYHCWSRTVNGQWLFGDVEKEVLRKMMWQIADFCGVEILTYIVMSNHFHLLVRVLQWVPVSDAELLRRYGVLYPKPTRFEMAQLAVIKQQLAVNGPKSGGVAPAHARSHGGCFAVPEAIEATFHDLAQ